jgi:predicted nuclease of predicted toxin-antitoxin system
MRLLFDHNLSPRLVQRLIDVFPETNHVAAIGLERASDIEVWNYARINDYMLVTKDSDFNDLAVLRGFPPKVIWLRIGNCTTRDVEYVLRSSFVAIRDFHRDTQLGVFEIYGL